MHEASLPVDQEPQPRGGLRSQLRSALRSPHVRLLLVLAVLLRVALIFVPGIPHYGGDADSYVEPAKNMVHAGQFATGICPGPTCEPLLWRVPTYSIFIALFQEIPRLPLGAIYVEQVVLDVISILLAVVIGSRLGGKRLGLLAGGFVALNPFLAVFSAEIMSESLTVTLVMLLTYGLVRAAESRLSGPALPFVAFGALMGVLALTRQVFAVLPGFVLVFLWMRPFRTWLRAALLVSLGFWPIVAPWIGRQYVVARDHGVRDASEVMIAPRYAAIVKPGFAAWERSFEEPFFMENFAHAPAIARYLLPGEEERTVALFARLNENNLVNSPEIDAEFAAIARERRAAHPLRTRVWAPLTRFGKAFAAPRLSGLGIVSSRLSTLPGKLLMLLAMAFNTLTSLPGFAYGIWRARDPRYRVLMLLPVFIVVAHLPVTFGGQSRYMVPALPHLAMLTGAWALSGIAWLRARRPAGNIEGEPSSDAKSRALV